MPDTTKVQLTAPQIAALETLISQTSALQSAAQAVLRNVDGQGVIAPEALSVVHDRLKAAAVEPEKLAAAVIPGAATITVLTKIIGDALPKPAPEPAPEPDPVG